MKYIVKYVYIICTIIFLGYLLIPNPQFPEKLPNSVQSFEPADVETPNRRGYYTDMSREEVLKFYMTQVKKSDFYSIPFPAYRLNYPPEEAQILIRDQARSTFLEEIVHPFRESYYINGFEPKEDKDMIFIEGRSWRQKVIVKYVPSNIWIRLLSGTMIMLIIPFIFNHLRISFIQLYSHIKKA